jgi:hypothetical protein
VFFHQLQNIDLETSRGRNFILKENMLKGWFRVYFTILLLPILHLRLLPIHLPLRISCAFFTSQLDTQVTLSVERFKHLDSSTDVKPRPKLGLGRALCIDFSTNFRSGQGATSTEDIEQIKQSISGSLQSNPSLSNVVVVKIGEKEDLPARAQDFVSQLLS